ncbi:MAG: hypothetical protein AB7G93_22445 [Bdellovibrionales bacterium]
MRPRRGVKVKGRGGAPDADYGFKIKNSGARFGLDMSLRSPGLDTRVVWEMLLEKSLDRENLSSLRPLRR